MDVWVLGWVFVGIVCLGDRFSELERAGEGVVENVELIGRVGVRK